ncbi:nitrite reductase small subunit NirD [Streptomyces sp. K1PA1]|uniref:Nitrite reductase small subunit NirD n=1 Tax=Streptomyces tropicalis TaxID=3034234 RepID=A0ABT6A4Y4_9ACTN|nr:nitrite reductase small subunit NirD [Streptomyces tropicalis]MDF3298880.1 nitrite reductase small subunit NirD [Streptomyces tropicalis]
MTQFVEVFDGTQWFPACTYAHLVPGRGVAVLGPGGEQIALFRDRAGQLYAIDNRDPFSGAHVLSRGILGSRGDTPTLASPMYKQVFDLRDGRCLDEDTAPDGTPARLRVWPARTGDHSVSRPAARDVRKA